MRILTVTHYQPPHRGGIETVAAALVQGYGHAGHASVWLSSDVPPAAPAADQVRVPAWNILEERLGVPYPLWSPHASATVRRWVDWCDVVHCHDCLYPGTLLALRHARHLGKPVLMTQHVGPVPYRSGVLRAVQGLAYATIGRHVHRNVEQVVFISRTVCEWFRDRVTYRRTPRFLANGVDADLFQFGDEATRGAARQRLQLPAGKRIILFVGRFVEKKGIAVIEPLIARYPDSLFILIGEGPIEPRRWTGHNVRVEPFQSRPALRDYYWASDVLLLPSRGEGFPLVVMEAMACGTPAIISPETFAAWDDGPDYFLVSTPAPAAVAALLDRPTPLLTPAGRYSVSAYAGSQWQWTHVTQQYLDMLQELRQGARDDAGARDRAARSSGGATP